MPYRYIAEYISAHHAEFSHLNSDAVRQLANNYLDIAITEQHEGMPKRRLASRDPENVKAAIKKDLAEQVKKGHTQNIDTLIQELHLTYRDRKLIRRKVRHLLLELREEGRISISDSALEARRDTGILRMHMEEAIRQLEEQGYRWVHENPTLRITSKALEAKVKELGLEVNPCDISIFMNNSRQTTNPIGERMRTLTNVSEKVDELLAQGLTDPDEIIQSIKAAHPQAVLNRVTQSKIRAYVYIPQVKAYVAKMKLERGASYYPNFEEVKNHLGIRSTKILPRIFEELGLPSNP